MKEKRRLNFHWVDLEMSEIELEKSKGLLEGKIDSISSSVLQNIRDTGEDAALKIQQQVTDIKNQIDALLAEALETGKAIAEMRQITKKGKESEKSLDSFLKEVQGRLRRN